MRSDETCFAQNIFKVSVKNELNQNEICSSLGDERASKLFIFIHPVKASVVLILNALVRDAAWFSRNLIGWRSPTIHRPAITKDGTKHPITGKPTI